MTLIFDDLIQATDCSGLYTLMGFVNGTWQDIHTISGPSSGSIEVDASVNTIAVDTTLFIPGETYQFRWVDGNGVSSNIITLAIPSAGSGAVYYYSGGSGAGLGNVGTIEFLSYLYDWSNNLVQLAFNINVPTGGTLSLVDLSIGEGVAFAGNPSWIFEGEYFNLEGFTPLPGHQYVIRCSDVSGNVTNSNAITAIGCTLVSISDDGNGYCEVNYGVDSVINECSLYLCDMTAGTVQGGVSGISGITSRSYIYAMPFIVGHEYRLKLVDSSGNISYCPPLPAEPASSAYYYSGGPGSGNGDLSVPDSSSYYYYDSGISGLGSGNLSTINFLGISPDGSTGIYVAASGLIAKSNIAVYVLDVTAGTSTTADVSEGLGDFFAPSADIDFPFTVGHQYQLALVDLDANPDGNVSGPGTILSNALTAANLSINHVSNQSGFIEANITIDPSLGIGGGVANLPLADSTGIYGLAGVLLPFSPETQDVVTGQLYVPGHYIQIQIGPSASSFKQLP